MAKTDVINLAKSGKATAKKPAARKPAAKKPAARKRKPAVKEPTAEEIRDQKAKETIEKLLEDSPITTLDKKEEDLLILDETPEEEPKGVEWLEEQVGLLSQKNEAITAELKVISIENEQLRGGVVPTTTNDGEVKGVVIKLFDELQTQLINRGVNPNTGNPNFVIHTVAFMNRLIKFFPFLEQMKRYK